jgi:hypothetical protein
MKLKTNLVLGVFFLGLLAFVYLYEIRGGTERQEAATQAKSLLALGDADVRQITIERRDTTLVLQSEGGQWRLTSPVEDRADDDAVQRYVQALRETERESVMADSGAVVADPRLAAKYGLAMPRLRVRVETAAGGRDTLWFGADSPTDRYTYAQLRGANPQIVTVRAWRYDNLDKGLFDLRDRRLLTFEPESVQEVHLTGPQGRIVLERVGAGNWRLREPLVGEADGAAIDQLLLRLSNSRAESFVAEKAAPASLALWGLSAPATGEIALLVGRDRAEQRLQVGSASSPDRYFGRDPRRWQVVLVDSSVAGVLRRDAASFRQRQPLRFDREAVVGLELDRATGRVAARRDTAGTWSLTEPAGRQATGWRLEQLLTDLTSTRADSIIADAATGGGQYGLTQPTLTVRVLGEAGPLLVARFGQGRDGRVYAAKDGDSQTYQISADARRRLDPSLDEISGTGAAAPAGADAEAPR